MRNDHDRDPVIFIDLFQKLQDGLCRLRIQGTGGLIAQQDLGIGRQRSGDRHTLLLSAGQLGRICLRLLRQSHDLQKLLRPFSGILPAHGAFPAAVLLPHAGIEQRKTYIINDILLHQQIKMLKDHRDLSPLRTQLLL